MDRKSLRKSILKNKGFTLIELLIALVISSVVMAAMYRTAISKQKAYTVQDQVIDMQQNIRNTINQMAREIRMAGYGGNMLSAFGGSVNSFTQIVTAVNGANNDSITIIMADEVAQLSQNAATGANQLQLNASSVFDTNKKKYLCLNGQNNYLVQSVNGNLVTLDPAKPLQEDHLINEPVYLVKAITFSILPNTTNLVRDENTGAGGQVLADNIEGLQLQYMLAGGTVWVDSPSTPSDIREAKITISGRTSMPDPQHSGDGYRRQIVTSDVVLRNMGL